MAIRYLSGINVDSNTLFVDSTNNRVGIGTASPNATLSLYAAGTAYINFRNSTNISSTYGFVIEATGNNSELWNYANGYLRFGTNNAERLRITADGNVGIGITAPAYKLDVDTSFGVTFGAGGQVLRINREGLGSIGITGTKIYSGETLGFQSNDASTSFNFAYGNASLMTIKSDGNVGIGTTSPSYKLDVNGVGNFSNGFSGPSSETGYRLKFYDNGGTHNDAGIGLDGSAVGGEIMWFNALGGFYFGLGTGGTKVTISNAGNVGIGTTSPNYKLDVNGSINIYSGNSLRWGSGDVEILNSGYSMLFSTYTGSALTEKMRITSAGNVGIGTTSPSDTLDLYQAANTTAIRLTSAGVGSKIYRLTSQLIGVSNAGFGIQNATDGRYELAIDGAGNVGIGTTSPVAALHVQSSATKLLLSNTDFNTSTTTGSGLILHTGASSGNTYGQIYAFQSGNTVYANLVVPGGNVGIGTTSPSYKLDVSGTGRFTAALAADSNIDLTGDLRYQSNAGFGLKSQNGTRLFEVYNTGISFVTALAGTSATFSSSVTASSLIKSGGTSSQYLMADGSVSTLTNPVTGTGTTNYVPKWTSGSAIGNSQIFDNGTNVGIGTASPSYKLDVNGEINARSNSQVSGNAQIFTIDGTNHAYYAWSVASSRKAYAGFGSSGSTTFELINENTGGFIIGTNGSQQFIITSAGNVGIGTTSPSAKLDVAGIIKVAGNGGGYVEGYRIIWETPDTHRNIGANAFQIENVTSQGLTIGYSSNQFVVVNTSGNVGIGTTSPVVKLQVDGTITSTGVLTAYTSVPSINIGHNGDSAFIAATSGGGANTPISFSVGNNNEKMRITAAGNVGIGTTAPSSILHVDGTDPYVRINNVNSANNQGIKISYNYSDTHGFHLSYNANVAGAYIDNTYPITSGQAWGDIYFRQNNGTGTMLTRMTIKADGGNVGIGTTSPSYTLDVSGTARTTTGTYLGTSSGNVIVGGTTSDLIYGFKFIAIGNTAVQYAASTGTYLRIEPGAADTQVALKADARSGAYPPMAFHTSDTERMRITSAGNVLIGTTSAGVNGLLQVSGSIGLSGNTQIRQATNGDGNTLQVFATQFVAGPLNSISYSYTGGGLIASVSAGDSALLFDSGRNVSTEGRVKIANTTSGNTSFSIEKNGVSTFFASTVGNVGIGTASPSQALHVTGNVRVTGAYYDSSNSAGSSGQVLSSTGSGTAWVNQGEATATSLYDLLPAARTTYAWTVQLTAGTWADIFSSNTVLSNGTWMVQAFVNDYAVGGQQYSETYSGVMSWGEASSTNQGGPQAISEIVLHRSGHAANSGNFYLRTVERVTSTLLFQGMSNQTYSAASTINFKFVKIF